MEDQSDFFEPESYMDEAKISKLGDREFKISKRIGVAIFILLLLLLLIL